MRKKVFLKGLKYQDLIFTCIYGFLMLTIRISLENFISIPIFYFALKVLLNRRYVQTNRRVIFLLMNLGWLFISGFEMKLEFLLLILFIVCFVVFYQFYSHAYLDMLVWVGSFPLIEEGHLLRDKLVINQQAYPINQIFPLTQKEFDVVPKHLKMMDSKLYVEEIEILDKRYKAYQIHH